MASVQLGQRVVRSPTWTWRDQDGGDGHVGTVVKLSSNNPHDAVGTPLGWVKIRWDNGYSNNYQAGSKDCFDLLLFDNAPAGVLQTGIECNGCSENPIVGMRWKCIDPSCPDYDLCTSCYMADKHNVTHSFSRFPTRSQTGTSMPPRFGDTKTTAKGLFPGATVKPGKDWQGEESEGKEGDIVEISTLEDRPRSAAYVLWSATGTATTHRVGCGGQVELAVLQAGSGMAYYAGHLPLLGKELGFETGDHVAVALETETLELFHTCSGRHWTSDMGKVFGKIGEVCEISSTGDVKITYPDGNLTFTFHPEVLSKVPTFGKGDRVQVNRDLTRVMTLQENSRNGWLEGMEQCLGGEGVIMSVDNEFNAMVKLDTIPIGPALSWHPCTLTLLKKSQLRPTSIGFDPDTEDLSTLLKAFRDFLQTENPSENVTGGDEGKELIQAAKFGKVDLVVQIVSKSPGKVNAKIEGKSALHKAAGHGHLDVVKALVTAGAELEITDPSDNTPLHYAVEGDEPAVAKYLLEHGADVNRGNENGRRALHFAAWKGHVDCARVLMRNKCDVNFQDNDKDTAIHDAIFKDSLEVIELILEAPNIDLSLTNKRELNPLQFCAFLDRPQAAELIVQAHPKSIILPREDGHTILHIAAVNNHVRVMKIILAVQDHGLCLDAKNAIGLTALHLAASKGQAESIEFLVSEGADINCPGADDNSALHLIAMFRAKDASQVDDTPTLRKIRQRYKDCGVTDSAAAMMCFMVSHGASIVQENEQCRTPLSYVTDMKLKRTLKKIARGDNGSDDLAGWEDLGEDVDVKASIFEDDNEVVDEDNDVIANRNARSRDKSPTPLSAKDRPDIRSPSPLETGASPGNGTSRMTKDGVRSSPRPPVKVFDLVHEIDVSELEMGVMIGKGQFGEVFRATWKGTPVAVKKILTTGNKKDDIEKEVSIHRRASHPNIVQMMALGYKDTQAYLVMQLIEGKSLNDVIFPDKKDTQVILSKAQKLRIAREMLQAVTYMHACRILHLDIKPANVLIETTTLRPYLCDLGLAHIKNRGIMSVSSVIMRGTPCFMPPEALASESGLRHSDKHDVYSVAGTLVELFSSKRLWGDRMNPLALMAQIMAGVVKKPISLEALDPEIKGILEPCFDRNPNRRPSAHELLDHFNALK